MRGGQFSLSIVRLAVDLVVRAGTSMRGAAASLSLIVERLGLAVDVPSSGAIRSWLLRLGCFALTCELAAGVWVLFVDHTVQIGPHKLLVILGAGGFSDFASDDGVAAVSYADSRGRHGGGGQNQHQWRGHRVRRPGLPQAGALDGRASRAGRA